MAKPSSQSNTDSRDDVRRDVLPIPDPQHVGLTTYDAKDPNTSYPPIKELRPPAGAPNVLIVLIDDVGFAASSAFGGPCHTPVAERLAGDGLKLNRFHTTALCSPTRQALLTGRNHHSVGHGGDHRDGHLGARQQQHPAQGQGADRRDAASSTATRRPSSASATRCRSGRSPPSARSTSGPPDPGSSTSTASSAARPTSTTRASTRAPRRSSRRSTPEEGYTLTEDLADHAITWVRQQKALMPDKPFFMYFAPGATHAPAPRAQGVVGQVPGQVRRGLGCAAGEDLRPAEEARRDPRRRRADPAPRRDPGLGRHARRTQAGAGPADGDLRRLPGADRPRDRPGDRRDRRSRRPRRHADLLHHRRQRRLGRGHARTAASTR